MRNVLVALVILCLAIPAMAQDQTDDSRKAPVADTVASTPGPPQGLKGDQGDPGAPGQTGAHGDQGRRGPRGHAGRTSPEADPKFQKWLREHPQLDAYLNGDTAPQRMQWDMISSNTRQIGGLNGRMGSADTRLGQLNTRVNEFKVLQNTDDDNWALLGWAGLGLVTLIILAGAGALLVRATRN